MAVSVDVILIQAVDEYIRNNPQDKINGTKPDRAKIKEEVLNQTQLIIDMQNVLLTKGTRMKVPDRLQNIQIAWNGFLAARPATKMTLTRSVSTRNREKMRVHTIRPIPL